MTDLRAALAEALHNHALMDREWSDRQAGKITDHLAERGVRLVNVEQLAALLYPYMTKEQAAAIFAALSGGATDVEVERLPGGGKREPL